MMYNAHLILAGSGGMLPPRKSMIQNFRSSEITFRAFLSNFPHPINGPHYVI